MKFTKTITVDQSEILIDLLARNSNLSRTSLKDCLIKGGVWQKRKGRKERKVRRAKTLVNAGDVIRIFYDEHILQQTPAPLTALLIREEYSIWIKPPLILSQGTRFGDHCSVMRIAEKQLTGITPYLVHRLDREACGLVLLAHSSKAAAKFSHLFRERKIVKKYRAVLCGLLQHPGATGSIIRNLEGKDARTEYQVTHHDLLRRETHVEVDILTGRYHQIRKHFEMIGHPLVGDYRYGSETKTLQLHLAASELEFICPFNAKKVKVVLPETEMAFVWKSA